MQALSTVSCYSYRGSLTWDAVDLEHAVLVVAVRIDAVPLAIVVPFVRLKRHQTGPEVELKNDLSAAELQRVEVDTRVVAHEKQQTVVSERTELQEDRTIQRDLEAVLVKDDVAVSAEHVPIEVFLLQLISGQMEQRRYSIFIKFSCHYEVNKEIVH